MSMNSTQNQGTLHQQIEQLTQQLRHAQSVCQCLEENARQSSIQIETLQQELSEARQYKNEFLLSMSHELRTPLNAMQLQAQLIERWRGGATSGHRGADS